MESTVKTQKNAYTLFCLLMHCRLLGKNKVGGGSWCSIFASFGPALIPTHTSLRLGPCITTSKHTARTQARFPKRESEIRVRRQDEDDQDGDHDEVGGPLQPYNSPPPIHGILTNGSTSILQHHERALDKTPRHPSPTKKTPA